MGTLVFVCPATGEEVSTGIEMDLATLEQLRLAKVYCPRCRQQHQMVGIEYWLSQVDEPTPLEETAEAA
jgi:ribosome-interacting GTPase 1